MTKRTQLNYEAGSRAADSNYWVAISEAGADIQYILTGTPCAAAAEPALPEGLNFEQQELLAAWVKVPDRFRQSIFHLIREWNMEPVEDDMTTPLVMIDPDRYLRGEVTEEELQALIKERDEKLREMSHPIYRKKKEKT
ncbi:MAG: hypothetical protein JMN25_17370 [gamma proteobacterium endosymbiont of Lamellibrachia anaximandri]|nr:hypothetical protein [gamma proteobacterium endosymbiont of Lamellibrachia anaximandri]